ncbi:MAG: heavy metal resistance protein CzcA, partial [Nitrosopumilaceae archaeon]|nr:heavy metal resistance protein CzcA [Nitrosopumilaceae archaeon]
MNLNDLRIVVDEREKKSGVPDLLRSVGVNLEIKTLQIGDYIVKPETVIERKNLKDFFVSIFDGRLFN